MDLAELEKLAAAGESETVEFKKSTGQLTRAGETLCAFLNGQGGRVLIGVTPEGSVIGQQVADTTQRAVAAMLTRFEPPAGIGIQRVALGNKREVLVLEATASPALRPFIFEGKPYQRIGSTTSVMPQARYQSLLLERAHVESRWENTPATDYDIADLDEEEILRTLRQGREAGRLPESTPSEGANILDRLGLRKAGRLLQAAVVLFGTRFLPDFPQCHLRLARFKGTDKTEFLDNRQVHGHAFDLLDEAMTFLMRHLPIRGRFEPNRLERIDEPLFPTAALREALVNALCHRDYAIPGGAVSVAIYDDRLEIWSQGVLPFGLRPADLKGEHISQPRNPLITSIFYRRGLIEQWGRGTNRIVELCVAAGHPEPDFDEVAGAVVVRFHPVAAQITPEVAPEVTAQVAAQVAAQVTAQVEKVVRACDEPLSRDELQAKLGLEHRENFRKSYLIPALAAGLIERTIPDKPRSRLQKYRLTEQGRAWLAAQKIAGDKP